MGNLEAPLKALKAVFAATIVGVAAVCGAADVTYPAKSTRLLVGFVPGGGSDLVARILAKKLAEAWGQPFIVDNRAGAGGIVAAEITAKANPDGYTLLMTSSSLTIQPSAVDKLPYDTLRDFAPVTLAVSAPYLLVVHPALEAKSVKELIELAKSRPGKINSATAGSGSSVHLSAVLFNSMAGVDIVLVPYKGVAGVTDLIAGQVQMTFQGLPVLMPHVKAGRLRPLAVTSSSRTPLYPEIPTIAEAGVAGYDVTAWYGVIGPARMPQSIIDKLHAGISSALQAADVRQTLSGLGLSAVGSTPRQFAETIRVETEKWKQVTKRAGLQPG